MSDAPSSTSDKSSTTSPRSFLDQRTSAVGSNAQTSNGAPKVAFLPGQSGGGGGSVFEESALRRQSPESDAVASSDDEEQKGSGFFSKGAVLQLSSRRPSYAAEFHTRQRTYSITSGGPLSPTTSHPSTPQGDTAAWAAGGSGAAASSGSALGPLWGGSIWNADPSRKSPPKQLNMQLQSSSGISNQNPLFAGSEALPSPTTMPANSNSEFPIPIPLVPQYRNYRSMSFSVGQQMELEDQTRPRLSPPGMLGGRSHAQPGLQHRPSRPSLLSGEQFADSPSPLRSVFENEDEETGSFPQTSYFQGHPTTYSRAKYETTTFRGRSASAATIPVMQLAASGLALGGKDDRIDEYSESALAEEDDIDFSQFHEQRRFSEAPRTTSLMFQGAENQRVENLRQTTWQSGGMFGLGDAGTQSRRHSFAGLGADFAGSDLLAKRSIATGENGMALGSREALYGENARLPHRQSFSAKAAPMGPPAGTSQSHHLQQLPPYASNSRASPPPGPHRGMMSMSMHAQPRSQQLLYFVTFKACRGDVFYVQEGTGLRVRVGDLVIVEADRGTDLGTVIAENISWQRAKELKEQYAKEQYNVLMMYASRRTTAAAPPAASSAGLNGANGSPFANGSSTGSMGHGHAQGQEGQTADLKPKMIKRLAQPHEIQTLRDKEANEAKAKRVCQQKVLEHRLPMEILDAEFQMDWKKLTFYYFADSYINFNSLVTDLFKVYKTRIWMSAMNPASFAHPAGVHPPGPGISPSAAGALGPIGETSDVMHPQYVNQGQAYSAYPSAGSAGGVLGGAPRASAQQQHGSMAGFPSRHSPSATDFVPHSGYNPGYLNGVSSQQSAFTLGDGHGHNGTSELWMGLQGLSLNSH